MPNVVHFDRFEVDLDAGQLRKRGIRINLREQSFQVLASLLEHPGRVVTREELRQRLWHDDVFVDFDNNLNIVVARLREALNDSADRPRFIETLPKRGYRFLLPVTLLPLAENAAPVRRRKLVVLPFMNLSGDAQRDYFGDALTEEMITALASFAPERLAVIARTTAMHYKGTNKDAAHIGRELAVDYIVEGAVTCTDGRASINAQLIDATDQTHLFARKYEIDASEALKMPLRVAQDLVAHIPGLSEESGSTTTRTGESPVKPIKNAGAYREYLEGRRLLDSARPGSVDMARQHLERAVALDPEFADAYDGLAESYWYQGYLGFMPPRQAFSAGIMHAVRALEIDNKRAETHALLGQFHKIAEYNWREVDREMHLALRLNANSPVVRTRYAISGLMPHGRVREAAEELERVLEIDPLCLLARGWLGIMFVLGRCFERGIEQGQVLLELDSNNFVGHFVLGICLAYQRKFDDALEAHRKAIELSGATCGTAGWLGLTLALAGRTAEARELLTRLEHRRASAYVPATNLAWIHLGLGEIDDAFKWMSRAVEDCDQFMMPIKTYGFLDHLRSDPRYAILLRNMNLPLT